MPSDDTEFLDAAGKLAHRIADSAISFEDRCNWTGALPDAPRRSEFLAAHAALGPDLYEGTSGVALFLAEAGVKLDDARLRATALGAINHALAHSGRVATQARDGLYTGAIGIAYAAARVAGLLEADHLLTRARELVLEWHSEKTRSAASDVLSGCAGAVTGLVAISALIDEPWILDSAVELGEELAARAQVTAAGWSWAAPRRHSDHNLCGYSHGAAGIGQAFLELFGATGDTRFREAGERAFDYERSWFDPRSGTWPDLRGVARQAGRDAPMPTPGCSWCNGVAGIAVSRLRATELLASPVNRRDAALALAACERHVSELLATTPDDFSLCHGAAGAADVLLYAGTENLRHLAAQIGRQGIERHLGSEAAPFPCGVPVGKTPALMLGFAGIGMFYLRLSDPGLETPLLVRRMG
jgi:lantibiotic biosynthesis protein